MRAGESRGGSWVMPAVAVSLLAVLVAAFWGPVVRLILEPLAWLLWAGWRLLAAVDQNVWWVLLALACAVPVIRLFDAQLRSQEAVYSGGALEPDLGGRVEHWTNRAAGMRRGAGGREALRADLAALATSVAQTTRTPLPPELDRAAGSAKQVSPRGAAAGRAFGGLLRRLPGFRRRRDEKAIEELLNWMEVALEIRDDEHVR